MREPGLASGPEAKGEPGPKRDLKENRMLYDPTLADGILDRLVHNAHRIEMRGDSMRKNRGKPNA